MIESQVTHEKWIPETPFLVDHSKLNTATLMADDMRIIADLNEEYSARIGYSKYAHVVARDLEFGMARMWQALVEINGKSPKTIQIQR